MVQQVFSLKQSSVIVTVTIAHSRDIMSQRVGKVTYNLPQTNTKSQ